MSVDFHAHILPGADHGSTSIETSLVQLEYAEAADVSTVIATPHFYPHRHTLDAFLKRRTDSYETLLSSYRGNVKTVLGAEVLLCEGLENLEGLERLCIEGTNALLIELPFSEFRDGYVETVRKIKRRGFEVLLAHVDRYAPTDIESLIDVGVSKLQVNAEAFAKLFKSKKLIEWAKHGYVVALGSDIHGKDQKAYKRFVKANRYLFNNLNLKPFLIEGIK